MKKIFMTDLDGTIIYSKNYEFDAEKVLVDKYNGYEAFMNKHLYTSLCEFNKIVPFIPITTRSLDEYERINLPIIPDYALVSNGAILLKDGNIDNDWLNESRKLIKESQCEMNFALEAINAVVNDFAITKLRYINDFFIFIKSDKSSELIKFLEEMLDFSTVELHHKRNKVYILPKSLSKGNALLRLKKLLHCDYVIAAGDSGMDTSMLELADKTVPCDILREKGEYINE